jgi:hypothetical protein
MAALQMLSSHPGQYLCLLGESFRSAIQRVLEHLLLFEDRDCDISELGGKDDAALYDISLRCAIIV